MDLKQIYIHFAKENLNKYRIILNEQEWDEKRVKENDIVNTIKQLRNNRDIINQITFAITQEYEFLFSQYLDKEDIGTKEFLKIAGNGKTINMASEAFQELDKYITQKLQSYVNQSNAEKVLNIMQGKEINKIIEKIAKNPSNSRSDLNDLIQIIINAINIVSPEIDSFATLKAIVEDKNQTTVLNSSTLKNLLSHIQGLYSNIEQLKQEQASEETIKKSLTTSIFNNIFSTDIGEEIYLISAITGGNKIDKEMEELSKTFTGKNTYTSLYSSGIRKVGGKADNILKNCSFSYLWGELGENLTEIKLNIGISDKFYRGGNWLGSKNSNSSDFVVDTGSAGQLGPILENLLVGQNDPFIWYCLYNGAKHPDNRWNSDIATLVTSRIILRALSTTFFAKQGGQDDNGKYDFAGYIIINGKVISILSIVNYVLNVLNNIQLSFDRTSQNTGAISVHFQKPKNSEWMGSKAQQKRFAIPRSIHEMEQLQKTKIEVKLHMQKLLKAI